jgi:hypothetical protein
MGVCRNRRGYAAGRCCNKGVSGEGSRQQNKEEVCRKQPSGQPIRKASHAQSRKYVTCRSRHAPKTPLHVVLGSSRLSCLGGPCFVVTSLTTDVSASQYLKLVAFMLWTGAISPERFAFTASHTR